MNQIFAYIGYLILLLNLALFFISFRNKNKAYKIFTCYLGLIFSVQIFAEILIRLHFQNLFLAHFYFIGQFVVLSFFYQKLLTTKLQLTFVKGVTWFVLLILGVQYALDPDQFFKFNLLEIAMTSLLVVVFAMMHLYNMLAEKKEYYYVTVGIIMYLLASTVLFLVGNLTIGLSNEFKLLTWSLNAFLVIVYQLFITFEWYKSFSRKAV